MNKISFTIESTEIVDSVIMASSSISNAGRMVESLIGKNNSDIML